MSLALASASIGTSSELLGVLGGPLGVVSEATGESSDLFVFSAPDPSLWSLKESTEFRSSVWLSVSSLISFSGASSVSLLDITSSPELVSCSFSSFILVSAGGSTSR